jgi:hypothetical protein
MARVARAMATAMKRAIMRVARAMAMGLKRAMATAVRAMVTATKRVLTAAARVMAMATKRARARVAKAMSMATRVLGEGRQRQQRGQWKQPRVWRAKKRALVMEIAIVIATWVVGDKKGDGNGG